MFGGFYTVRFQIDDAVGRSVMYARDGKMLGGNSTFAHLGTYEEAGDEILKLCVEVGGCLTGEHGVGIEKRELMRFQYAQIDLEQQMRVKAVFDPDWMLNPAKVFPLEGRLAA